MTLLRRARAAVKRILARFVPIVEFCHDCGVRQPIVWHADDALWLRVVGRPGGVVCPRCFDDRAARCDLFVEWVPVVRAIVVRGARE